MTGNETLFKHNNDVSGTPTTADLGKKKKNIHSDAPRVISTTLRTATARREAPARKVRMRAAPTSAEPAQLFCWTQVYFLLSGKKN